MAASAALLPVQPMMVSAVHTGMIEVAFAKRASEDPQLRKAHTLHKMSSLLGGALFVADDVFPKTPLPSCRLASRRLLALALATSFLSR
ncbi:hypothetical protein Tsubulata_027583 [Turnera subulata]|uniref:Uncharacterized protein n=1 Tax=Turnera subulata TaxID=218843 RepID=A0A9Q0JI87_9ROSI|nr:hypothetical protein Tsubulata_027583 [Turnera subulata]